MNMKTITEHFLAAIALAAATLSACNTSGESAFTDPYADVRPGMTIYNSVVLQNTVATDPAAVAVRLAMLIDEANLKQSSLDEVTVSYGSMESVKLKNLLFGQSVGIEAKSSEEEGYADGDYLLSYQTTSVAPIDTFLREGSYLVHTGGRSLAEATETEPWSVEVVSANMRLSTSSTVYRMKPQGSVKLYRQSSGLYRLDLDQVAAWFDGYEQYTSSWTGNFFWKPSSDLDNWSFSAHAKDNYTLYGQAQGATFYAFDDTATTRMSYRVEAADPVLWQPEKTGSPTMLTGGTETCRLTHATDYSAESFPSPTVQVSRTMSDNTILTTVYYNNYTVTL